MAGLTILLGTSPSTAVCLCALLLLLFIQGVESSIGCFVCKSYNGSDPRCEDPFNSTVRQGTNFSTGKNNSYLNPCWAHKKHHTGLFPGESCIKIKGYQSDHSKATMVIRTCALDSGTLTADTGHLKQEVSEIVRISSCGHFKFKGKQYVGCVQVCDTDGCNGATVSSSISTSLLFPLLLTLFPCSRSFFYFSSS